MQILKRFKHSLDTVFVFDEDGILVGYRLNEPAKNNEEYFKVWARKLNTSVAIIKKVANGMWVGDTLENFLREVEREKSVLMEQVEKKKILKKDGCDPRAVLAFNSSGILERKFLSKPALRNEDYYEMWAEVMNVSINTVRKIASTMKVGESFEEFQTILKETEAKRVEWNKRMHKPQKEDYKQRLAQGLLTVEEIVGKVVFNFRRATGNYKSNTFDIIEANVLVKASFEEVMAKKNDIYQYILKELEKDKNFQRFGISTNYLNVRMVYRKEPPSIIVIFTLKDIKQ